jgi:hypothetical protein
MQENKLPICLICKSTETKKSWLPPTQFNDKVFEYKRCCTCASISIYPIPNQHDLELIYGVNDHNYLKDLKDDQKLIQHLKWHKNNHRTIQLKYLNDILKKHKIKTLLDFATGSAFYMASAINQNIQAIGIEFSEDFAKLMSEKTGFEILGQKSFESKYDGLKFDAIHFGHILEHLEHPDALLKWARKFAHEETLIIVDGPVEENFCLSKAFVKTVSCFKGKRTVSYEPQHFTFTNRKSQIRFFESCNLDTLRYKIIEQAFPLPETCSPFRVQTFIAYLVSKVSIAASKITPGWGNVFHYVGKFKQ